MPCYVGVDYGSKRIGLAVSDAGGRLALPLSTVEVRGNLRSQASAVLTAVADYDVDAFVVGLPLNMDGTEGPQVRLTRRFGEELQRATDKTVHFRDERLSSHAAAELLQPADLTRKKKKRRLDRIAAQVLLQEYLDAQL
jgi:putative Holliday junction resolvase